jgi:hypothetical protein
MRGESRRSRESYTKVLSRIAERINKEQVYDLEWTDRFLGGRERGRIKVQNLWVVGSWAKGSLHCGDLDILVEIAVEDGVRPPRSTVARVVARHAPDVQVHVGNPKENESTVEFEEAVLVWSPSNRNWAENINAVKPNAEAARHPRPADELPFRPEQLYGDRAVQESLAAQVQNGHYACTWTAIDDLQPNPEGWPTQSQEHFEHIKRCCGKKTQAIMPYIIEYCENRGIDGGWRTRYGDKSNFFAAGTQVIVGQPWVPLRDLNELWCSGLAIVPHLSRRGPNGIWLITRSPSHPLEALFAEQTAYGLRDEFGSCVAYEVGDHQEVTIIDLFRTRKAAEKWSAKWEKEIEEASEVVSFSGPALLRIVSSVDLVYLGSKRIAITEKGRQVETSDHVSSPNEFRRALFAKEKKSGTLEPTE